MASCGKCQVKNGKLTMQAVCDLRPVSGSSPCALKFNAGIIDSDVDENATSNGDRKKKPRR